MTISSSSIKNTGLQAAAMLTALSERITSDYPDLPQRFPIENYVHILDSADPLRGFGYAPPSALQWCRDIETLAGTTALENYHKMVLLNLITDAERRIKDLHVPDSIVKLLGTAFQRILVQIEHTEAKFYLHNNELFRKDLALCRLRLLPCGSELVQLHSGVPRSLCLRGGLHQFARFADYFVLEGKGFRPWFESHWDRRLIRWFTPQHYDQCYRYVAELLTLNPEIKGMLGFSWWFDPALDRISPNLTFLRTVPLQYGARLFRVGVDAAATQAAIQFSAERRRLYAAGLYRPTIYLLAWAREEIIQWAAQHPA